MKEQAPPPHTNVKNVLWKIHRQHKRLESQFAAVISKRQNQSIVRRRAHTDSQGQNVKNSENLDNDKAF
jgi:hypothetical protein